MKYIRTRKCLSLVQGGASALETAAAEMQQAASSLVAIERQIGQLSEQGVSAMHDCFEIVSGLCFGPIHLDCSMHAYEFHGLGCSCMWVRCC